MTIEEVIAHWREKEEENRKIATCFKTVDHKKVYLECAERYKQLADWLEELKLYRDRNSITIHLDPDSDEVKSLLHDAYNKVLDDLMTKLDCDKYLLNEWQRDAIKDKVKELKAGGGDIFR